MDTTTDITGERGKDGEAARQKLENLSKMYEREKIKLNNERERLLAAFPSASESQRKSLAVKIGANAKKSNELGYKNAKELREALHVAKPIEVNAYIGFGGSINDATVNSSLEEFSKLVSGDLVSNGGKVRFHPSIYNADRAKYSLQNNMISLRRGDGEKTVIHELGHWLEHANPELQEDVINFYNYRTQGDEIVSLKDVTGKNYRSDEVAKLDNFIDPYMGKLQANIIGKQSSTEIISMGLEMFYSDPLTLATQDKEMFDFIYQAVRGIRWQQP